MRVKIRKKVLDKLKDIADRCYIDEICGELAYGYDENWHYDDRTALLMRSLDLKSRMARQGLECSDDKALAAVVLDGLAMDLDLDYDPDDLWDAVAALTSCARVFHKGEFDDDAFLKNIRIAEQASDGCKVSVDSILKYDIRTYPSFDSDSSRLDPPCIAVFDSRMVFPHMECGYFKNFSVNPYVILMMKRPIEKSHGNVLAFGCCLGYYAYMASQKSDVDSITIVEDSEDVRDFFDNHILPQFPNEKKIKVIQSEYVEYASKIADGQFDCCFLDSYQDIVFLPVELAIRKILYGFVNTETILFGNDESGDMVRRRIFDMMLYSLPDKQRADFCGRYAPYVLKDDRLYDCMRKIFAGIEISEPEDVDYWLDSRNFFDRIFKSKVELPDKIAFESNWK